MRLVVFFMLAGCLQLSARGLAQTISLSEKNASLEVVLKSIKQQSGYAFFYNYRLLEQSKPVTVRLQGVSLKEALDSCFKNQPLTYAIEGKLVTVTVKPSSHITTTATEDLAEGPVSGIVRDSIGRPLPDITVSIRGKKKAVKTDQNGRFTINAEPGDVLLFSSVNYTRHEIVVSSSSTNYNILLGQRVDKLGEIEVLPTGYQFIRKSNIVGAISSIKASELYLDGITTIEQAIQGKLPGVVVTNTSGQVGVRQKTRVRGTSTLFGSQDPVWVVDGIIQQDPLPFKASALDALGGITRDNFDYVRDYVGNAISWLNPLDIEDITVLKDASATAIYGVRAGNGVIVITTKKGKSGPATINYSVNTTVSERVTYDKLNLMNSRERVAVSKEIFDRGLVSYSTYNTSIGYAGALDDYLFKRISYEEFNRRVRYAETVNTDWFKALFRAPISTNHSLNISGGNASTRYYVSFGYNDTKGTAIGNNNKGYTGNVSITSRLNDRLNVSARMSASQKQTDGFYKVNPYGYASTTSRVIPAWDSAGNRYFYANTRQNNAGYSFNILDELDNTGTTNKTLLANASVDVNYIISKSLQFQSTFSYSSSNTNGTSYATDRSNYIDSIRGYDFGTAKITDAAYINSKLPFGGEYNQDNNQSSAVNWRNGITWSKLFNKKHAVTAMLGGEINSTKYDGYSETTYGWLRDRGNTFTSLPLTYTSSNVANPLLNMTHILKDNIVNNIGLYTTATYSYDNRYVVNASIRADYSNKFGQDTRNKFNPVWAGGVRWNVANEKWFEKTDWLSDMSVRTSFGFQRNLASNFSPDLIAKIPTGATSTIIDQFTGEYLLSITNLPYADLRWEKNTTINLGITLGLFKNKVQTSLDYYEKHGKDIITYMVVPEEYGVETMPVNGGSLNNRGLEISASFVPVRTKDFTWSVSLSTAKNYNEVKKTGSAQNLSWMTAVSGSLYKTGIPVSGFWAFDFQGINPANGLPIINLNPKAGSDSINDPTSYMKYMGKMDPDFTSGISMNFRYKKLSVSTSFYLQVGGKKFRTPAYNLTNYLPTEFENLSRELLARWTPDNTQADFPGLPDNSVTNFLLPNQKTYANLYSMYNYSSARVVNASTLRCNNINISYSLSPKVLTPLHLKTGYVGFGVTSPFAIVSSAFKGIDSEVATGGQPRTRNYSLNLNVGF